jgi:hypothetical protein
VVRFAEYVALALQDALKQVDVIRYVERVMERVCHDLDFGLLTYKTTPGKFQGCYTGLQLVVKGSIDGSRRTYTERLTYGSIPLSTLTAPMVSHHTTAVTSLGTRGVTATCFY